MKSYRPKKEEVERVWYEVDADDRVLGRLAAAIAKVLMGKHKPTFHPAVDTGDFVVVTNAKKIKLTGNKLQDKKYHKHSGYPGGLKTMNYEEFIEKHPIRVIKKAVKGMMPANKLREGRLKRLKVYEGAEHPHSAQKPEKLEA